MDDELTRTSGTASRGSTLRIIRIALLSGVLMFGGIAFFLTQQDGGRGDPEMAQTLQMVNILLLVSAVIGILWVQRRHAAERDPARRTSLNIIGWAMGEATALFGGVHFLLMGSAIPYFVGLVTMLAAFALVPIRE